MLLELFDTQTLSPTKVFRWIIGQFMRFNLHSWLPWQHANNCLWSKYQTRPLLRSCQYQTGGKLFSAVVCVGGGGEGQWHRPDFQQIVGPIKGPFRIRWFCILFIVCSAWFTTGQFLLSFIMSISHFGKFLRFKFIRFFSLNQIT